MCIIIVKPAGQRLSKWALRNSWDNNGDGAGFAYAKDDKIVIVKELHKFKRFWRTFLSHDLDNKNVILHFRIGTSGYHNLDNTHPFLINEHHALVHNGILSCVHVPLNSHINDTQIFINEYLKCMVQTDGEAVDWVNNKLAREYAEEIIGKSNKMAVINSQGEVGIWNEKEGHWNTDCWFSNRSYEDRSYFKSYRSYSFDKSEDQKEWEHKWGGINDTATYLRDWQSDYPKINPWLWPKSEDVKTEDTNVLDYRDDQDDIDESHSQSCLECGVLLSQSERIGGWGCCEDCVSKAMEGA